jgi:hypothetical protein
MDGKASETSVTKAAVSSLGTLRGGNPGAFGDR